MARLDTATAVSNDGLLAEQAVAAGVGRRKAAGLVAQLALAGTLMAPPSSGALCVSAVVRPSQQPVAAPWSASAEVRFGRDEGCAKPAGGPVRRVSDLGWDEARIAQARATFLALADAWDDPDLDVYNDL